MGWGLPKPMLAPYTAVLPRYGGGGVDGDGDFPCSFKDLSPRHESGLADGHYGATSVDLLHAARPWRELLFFINTLRLFLLM